MAAEIPARQMAETLYYRALDLVAGGDPSAAVKKFSEALSLDPDLLDAMHGLIRALQDSGDYDQAIAVAQELISRDADDPLAHTSLSILYQHKGMVPEAEAEALKAKLLGWKLELRESRSTPVPDSTNRMKPAKPRRPSTRSTARLEKMYQRLVSEYGPQQWWPAKSAFEVVIGAYLTQNTSWKAVERSILNLAAHQALSVEAIRNLTEEKLRELIRPSGYMVRKAAAIKAFVYWLDREYGGSLKALADAPAIEIRPQLLALPGVGPETADAILLYALGHPAMVVDEYLRRIVTRHKLLSKKAKYAEIQTLVVEVLKDNPPQTLAQHYNELHALVVMVGKTHCGPKPRCEGCPLARFLPANVHQE